MSAMKVRSPDQDIATLYSFARVLAIHTQEDSAIGRECGQIYHN
ncbi:hypothetical protein QUA71_15485 [Microcoleus sp. MON1_C5]